MYLQRLLQINMATLAGLATLLLGMGQDSPGKVLLIWLAAAASIWVTDIKGWLRVNRIMASVLALPLLAYALLQLPRATNEAWILVIANVVMYLQLILFFQKKDVVIYWQLAIISLLQVVVAAGFNHGAKFGILLVLYMIVGMSALALSFLYSQWSRYQRSDELPQPAPAPVGCRWPLLAAESAFSSGAAGSSRAGIVAELFMRLTMMATGVLVLTLVIFFTVPRLGRPAWKARPAQSENDGRFFRHREVGRHGPNPGKPRGSDARATVRAIDGSPLSGAAADIHSRRGSHTLR